MKYPTIGQALLYTFLLLIARKIVIALIAMNTVRLLSHQVSHEAMMSSAEFQATVSSLPAHQETFVLILNRHAVNMTLNWLCNTEEMPGVHNNSLIVTLDEESSQILRSLWPEVRQLNWIVPGLAVSVGERVCKIERLTQDPFNYGDGFYQLFYLFRSNLARAMLDMDRTFWMIQQDTFWAASLSSIPLPRGDYDIIFDRASEGGPLIAGGYYLARPTAGAKSFFRRLSNDISWWYAPDNAYMTSLCQLSGLAKCGGLPFNLITNWQWLEAAPSDAPPTLIQFDGETKLGGKLGKMKRIGFYFLNDDGRTCNASASQNAQNLLQSTASRWGEVASYSHGQFKLYQSIVDGMYSNPVSAYILDRLVLPYAHFCMLTL